MSDKLKVGVIGVGGIAHTHIPGWRASEHAELIAGCDLQEELLQAWGKTHQISRLSTDPADLLRDPDIAIIDICTPNTSHAPLVIAALEAGKHVICEKPLAPTPEEIRQIIKTRDESGKLVMAAHHFRFASVSQAMKKEIDTGVLGNVYHARCWMLRRNAFWIRPTFTQKRYSGGGPCLDIGAHILDLALWFMGHPCPVSVNGVARAALAHQPGAFSSWDNKPIPPDFDVEDFAAAFIRFENDATLILEVSWLLHHDTPNMDMQLWLYGTDGGCHWPKGKFLQTNYATRQQYNTSLQLIDDAVEPHALECVEFARAVAEELPSPVPAEHALQAIEILDAVYYSQQQGREIRLARSTPLNKHEDGPLKPPLPPF